MTLRGMAIKAGAVIVLALLLVALQMYSVRDIADEATRLHLKFVADSIYEFRRDHGRWPASVEDLKKTSLAAKYPQDITILEGGVYIVNWPTDMKPEAKDNGGHILLYEHGAPARFGWVWVCWGDFRMEHMKREQVEATLQAGK